MKYVNIFFFYHWQLLWVRTSFTARCTRYSIMWYRVCQWLSTGRLF